jgi:hypothetical protein
MRAGRTFPRWLSLCAAGLVLLHLGGVLHLAVAPHGICWEHGVVEDLDSAPALPGVVDAAPGLSRATPGIRSDQHPHCPALWLLRQARLEPVTTEPVLAVSEQPVRRVLGQDVPRPSRWALHRAPKQSPPV